MCWINLTTFIKDGVRVRVIEAWAVGETLELHISNLVTGCTIEGSQ